MKLEKKHVSRKSWIHRHINDPYVKQAQARGYRSRAAFKLLDIAKQDRLFRPGMLVVDLGAAPGSWAQVAAAEVGPSGRVIATDLLPVEPIPGVEFVQGDLRDEAMFDQVTGLLGGRQADLVLCDMAPNLSGIAATDQARSRDLCELALEFAGRTLKPGGNFLVKTFQGAGYKEFLDAMRRAFATVASRKPGASRDSSAEMYLLGREWRNSGDTKGV